VEHKSGINLQQKMSKKVVPPSKSAINKSQSNPSFVTLPATALPKAKNATGGTNNVNLKRHNSNLTD